VARVSFIRRWLGDEPIQQIYYLNSAIEKVDQDAQFDELKRVFPEAELINLGP
jgi:hypothetical protein